MKPLAFLGALKQYLPGILYSLLGVIGLFFVYKLIMRISAGGEAVGGIVADKAENEIIHQQTGLSVARVQKMRSVAHDVAYELETLKDMGTVDKWTHIQFDDDTIDILNNIRSADEMICVSNFYENIFTNSRRLIDDLQEVLSTKNLNKVPYISALY